MYGTNYSGNAGYNNCNMSTPPAAPPLPPPPSPWDVSHQQQASRNNGITATTSSAVVAPSTTTTPYNMLLEHPPSNSREMRNKAEKMRRDKLNSFIKELATLVPICSGSGKRMDKTTVLRLAAAFLRLHQLFLRGNSTSGFLKSIDQFHLEQLVFEQRKGFLLILTTSGKIVFVSYSVQHILGHLQTDLMGQSIYNITLNEDQERLRNYLNSDADVVNSKKSTLTIRLRRAGTRTESPAFETVSVMGLQSPRPQNYDSCASSPASSSSSTTTTSLREIVSSTGSSVNGDLWVLFVQNYRPEPLSEKLMQASKDEYVTRHLVDGRIINCDQRISVITGYMSEEVSGLSAFNFMHKEDVRWVMIALRQMYDKGENTGTSCYRLLARNGQFIYLKTFGFLEVDGADTVESFICVNCLVPEDEGENLIQKMKERYSALVKNSSTIKSSESQADVEDPKSLQQAIIHLITDLPSTDHSFKAFSPERNTKPTTLKTEAKVEYEMSEDYDSISSSNNAIMPSSTTTTTMSITGPHHNNNGSSSSNNNNNKKKTGNKRLQSADSSVLSSSSSNKRHKPLTMLQSMKQMKVDNDNR